MEKMLSDEKRDLSSIVVVRECVVSVNDVGCCMRLV